MNRRRALAGFAGALIAYGCSHRAGGAAQDSVAGEYLVTLAPGTDAKAISDVYGRFGVKSVRPIGGNAFVVVLGEDPGLAAMQKLAAANAAIKAVQSNYRYRAR
jgi:hypothetical protein